MNKVMYELQEQKRRRKAIIDLFTEYQLSAFDPEGNYHRGSGEEGTRERLWFAEAFLSSDSLQARDMGNVIIVSTTMRSCHFAPMVAIQLLTRLGERLTVEARVALLDYLKREIDSFSSEQLDFIGVNDNFPAMSTFIVLIGGQMLGRQDLVDIGIKRLYQLKALLTRRGFVSEFNSPTYSGIQLYATAEIANHLQDEELKSLALQCEERLWADQLSHLHEPTSQVAGPYSRAYTADSVGHMNFSRFVLYALLGERLRINPLSSTFASPEQESKEVLHFSDFFMQMSCVYLVNTEYHCPVELVEHALNKPYPYEVIGTVELSSSTDALASGQLDDSGLEADLNEYPAGSGIISTYMTEHYALGTSTREFHNGSQTDSFHLLYSRSSEVAVKQRDIRTVYARYVVNDKKPGQTNFYERFGVSSSDVSLWDEGRKLALQHKQTAMLLYKPRQFGRLRVTSLKMSIIFPCQYGGLEEIWFGERKMAHMTGESVEPCTVYIKDGPVYMAFHPLISVNHGRIHAVRAEYANDYCTISFYNYEGEERDFDAKSFVLTGNGVVAEFGSIAESGDFATFRETVGEAQIRDEYVSSIHSRHTVMRKTTYKRGSISLACEISPCSEGIKNMEINGSSFSSMPLSMTGFDVSRLSFLSNDRTGY